MAIAIALPEFNDLGRSVTPIFHLMDHVLRLAKKMKKIYRLEVLIFCKMHHRIPFLLVLRLPVRGVQMLLEGFWNYLRNRSSSTKYD